MPLLSLSLSLGFALLSLSLSLSLSRFVGGLSLAHGHVVVIHVGLQADQHLPQSLDLPISVEAQQRISRLFPYSSLQGLFDRVRTRRENEEEGSVAGGILMDCVSNKLMPKAPKAGCIWRIYRSDSAKRKVF